MNNYYNYNSSNYYYNYNNYYYHLSILLLLLFSLKVFMDSCHLFK